MYHQESSSLLIVCMIWWGVGFLCGTLRRFRISRLLLLRGGGLGFSFLLSSCSCWLVPLLPLLPVFSSLTEKGVKSGLEKGTVLFKSIVKPLTAVAAGDYSVEIGPLKSYSPCSS